MYERELTFRNMNAVNTLSPEKNCQMTDASASMFRVENSSNQLIGTVDRGRLSYP